MAAYCSLPRVKRHKKKKLKNVTTFLVTLKKTTTKVELKK